jgi:hypothetical protein
MPIWKLAPILTSSSDDVWANTKWYGPILVRAKNPGQARQLAARAFRSTRPAKPILYELPVPSPWLEESMVVCQRIPVSAYPPEGPDQILQPQAIEYAQR